MITRQSYIMYSDRGVKPAIRATCGSVTTQRQPERGIHTSQVSIVVPSRTAEIINVRTT